MFIYVLKSYSWYAYTTLHYLFDLLGVVSILELYHTCWCFCWGSSAILSTKPNVGSFVAENNYLRWHGFIQIVIASKSFSVIWYNCSGSKMQPLLLCNIIRSTLTCESFLLTKYTCLYLCAFAAKFQLQNFT